MSNVDITNLTTITLPTNLEYIGDNAFSAWDGYGKLTALTGIVIPATVKRIGNQAFKGSANLATITFEGQPEEIGYEAFHDTAWYGAQSDGMVYVGSQVLPQDRTIMYGYKGTLTSNLTANSFNEGTTFIGGLNNQAALTSITIPASVKIIGDYAFSDYDRTTTLTTVAFEPESQLQKIGESAFYRAKFTSISLPDNGNLQLIGKSAFEYSINLTSITIPNSVTRLDRLAFGDSAIVSLTLSTGLTTISREAFAYCYDLAGTVSFPVNVRTIGESAFSGNVVENFVFEANSKIEIIDTYAFSYCDELISMIIPSSVIFMGEKMFSSSDKFTTVNVVASSIPLTWNVDWNVYGWSGERYAYTLSYTGA